MTSQYESVEEQKLVYGNGKKETAKILIRKLRNGSFDGKLVISCEAENYEDTFQPELPGGISKAKAVEFIKSEGRQQGYPLE